MEFQTNFLAFMAAVEILFHCCLVYTLQHHSISKTHLYTLYVLTCTIYPQQMTTMISIFMIKHLCVQEDIFRKVYISIVKPTRCTNLSNLFYFGITLCMSRTVFPSIIRSSRLYIQQQVYVKQILLSVC
jgi:hypothetical protein